MVKVHKMFCIEWEISEKLKGINASELTNELLANHFNSKKSIDEINKEIDMTEEQMKSKLLELEELKNNAQITQKEEDKREKRYMWNKKEARYTWQ